MPERPTLVMLPGTLCDARVFARQRRALRAVADVRTIEYDGLVNRDAWLQRLLADLPPRLSIAGFSLGGIFALELLRRAPERIERLAMIASNARAGSAKARRNGRRLRRVLRRRGSAGGGDAIAQRNLPRYFHQSAARRQHEPLVRDMARGTPDKAALAQFEGAGVRPDGLPVLATFGGPLLIISGANDLLCPPTWQREMVHAQPAACWIELPRTGHFVPLEAPARLTAALARWLAAPPSKRMENA